MKDKIKKYEKIKKDKTKSYKEEMNYINSIIKAIKEYGHIKDSDSIETIVFKEYLILENVQKVAKRINELGFRVKTNSRIGERKYTSNDITEIITNEDSSVERELKDIVQTLQKKNYKIMAGLWR